MPRMGDIEREAADAVSGHHGTDSGVLAAIASDLARMAMAVGDLGGNDLIRRLLAHDLGRRLQPAEIDTVAAFVAGLEYPRTPPQERP